MRTVHIYAIPFPVYTTRKPSWNPVGVEPIHRKPADIEPGSLMSGTYRKVR